MTDLTDATIFAINHLEKVMETPAQKWLANLKFNKSDEMQVSDLEKGREARSINTENQLGFERMTNWRQE